MILYTTPELIKELTINGKVYAKYQIDDSSSTLFIHVLIDIVEGNRYESENKLLLIIQLVEKRFFHAVSWLKI